MNRKEQFDVIVLGAGPGGYPAAIKAAQCGKKVALVEPKQLGGTCLNRGCIPSKALIANAEVLQMVREADKYGIITGEVRFDFGKMAQRRDETIALLRHSLEGLISANGITLFRGFGTFGSPREVKVRGEDSGALLQADAVIIATGSEPKNISTFPFDRRYIHDSTSLLEINELPRSLLIVGGGGNRLRICLAISRPRHRCHHCRAYAKHPADGKPLYFPNAEQLFYKQRNSHKNRGNSGKNR